MLINLIIWSLQPQSLGGATLEVWNLNTPPSPKNPSQMINIMLFQTNHKVSARWTTCSASLSTLQLRMKNESLFGLNSSKESMLMTLSRPFNTLYRTLFLVASTWQDPSQISSMGIGTPILSSSKRETLFEERVILQLLLGFRSIKSMLTGRLWMIRLTELSTRDISILSRSNKCMLFMEMWAWIRFLLSSQGLRSCMEFHTHT